MSVDSNEIKNKICEAIKKFRLMKGLTAKELSTRTGIATSNISAIESGERVPKLDMCNKIANALGVSIDTLYGINEDDSLGTRMAKYRNNNIPPEDMNLGKCLDEIDEKTILDDFHRLNFRGKKEAIKRMSELTKLDEYTNKEGE